jgi:very-short-patch-repair endonuclease
VIVERQVPIDRDIVGFYCPEIRLVIDIDGNKRLLALGYMMLRVPNEDVLTDPEWFTDRIRSPHPSPGAPSLDVPPSPFGREISFRFPN